MIIIPQASDRLTHELLLLLSRFQPGRHRLLDVSALLDVTLEIRRATWTPRALLIGVVPRDPVLGLLTCAVEVGLGVAGL